jgi:nucleoside-diphosphate-sugar epimerase
MSSVGPVSPGGFTTEEELERFLSEPSEEARRELSRLAGDILVVGAGGKMGPTLCRLLRQAAGKEVTAVSRFSQPGLEQSLRAAGVRTVCADLLDRRTYDRLPDAANVFFLAGMKFGASAQEGLTWAMNVYVPALVAERFCGSRIVAFSTGNVYPFVPVNSGGAAEDTSPQPFGEYAQSCLGRERIFQFFSSQAGTPVLLVRLNYANEPRYGIVVDLVQKILAGEAIDLAMGHVNLIWQGDANDYIARSLRLAASPARILNVAGPETIAVRELAERLASIVGRTPRFIGTEEPTALLSNAEECFRSFGPPRVGLEQMARWIAEWVAAGGRTLSKPTKFQVRDGRF